MATANLPLRRVHVTNDARVLGLSTHALTPATKAAIGDAASIKRVRELHGQSGGLVLMRCPGPATQPSGYAVLARELDRYLTPQGSVLLSGTSSWRLGEHVALSLQLHLHDGVVKNEQEESCVVLRRASAPPLDPSATSPVPLSFGPRVPSEYARMLTQLLACRAGDMLDLERRGDVLAVDDISFPFRVVCRHRTEREAQRAWSRTQ